MIFLGTLNGERFLDEQLQSLARQRHQNWRLVASDDGSQDGTVRILEAFARQVPQQVEIRTGPGRSAMHNFMSLVTDRELDADYFAFADQDDVWTPDHLSSALAHLSALPPERPALHCGRTRIISASGRPLGYSPLFSRPPSFGNAIVQSIAGGNTMVFNRAARRLFLADMPQCPVAHDWILYQLVTGVGGHVHYDPSPTVLYRQHGGNLIGSNLGFAARMRRMRMLLSGRFARWTTQNVAALMQFEPLLTPDNRRVLRLVQRMQEGSLWERVVSYWRSGVYRQTVFGTLTLALAVALRRV